ncbi:MAG: hypothetical protein ACJ75S_06960 [Solirubrobacterales bacterium]
MTDEQKAAFINAQAACAMIDAMGMVAANTERTANGQTIAYDEKAFQGVIDRYSIGHNSVLTLFHG